MFDLFIYNDIKPGKLRKQFDKTVEQLSRGDFVTAEVKKMRDTGLYRARLDYENRLLFRFGRYNDQTCLLILEIIMNHAYDKSRFLRGSGVDHSKLLPRKKRTYMLALLAKHEIESNNPYNKKIFKRISRGNYQLNPDLSILIDGNWVSNKESSLN